MKNLKDFNLSSYVIYKDGSIYSHKSKRFIKSRVSVCGYEQISMTDDDGRIVQPYIHRLLCMAFLHNDDPENKIYVNHKDGDKLNNDLSNLEWCTPSENCNHANNTGLRTPTHFKEHNILPKEDQIIHDWTQNKSIKGITEDDVHNICYHLEQGYRACDVSRMLAHDRRFVQKIRDDDYHQWSHIVHQYDFSKISRKQRTSPETVKKICECLSQGKRIMEISRELDIDRKVVSGISSRKFYTDISRDYEF